MMTRTAGRELDAEIAEKVMGCHVKRHRSSSGIWLYDLVVPGGVNCIDFVEPDAPWSSCPRYSTDIAAAWQVHKTACGWIFSRRRTYFAALERIVRDRLGSSVAWPDLMMFIEPEDFCLAALEAAGKPPGAST